MFPNPYTFWHRIIFSAEGITIVPRKYMYNLIILPSIRQVSCSILVQVMAYYLPSAIPLSKPLLAYCRLDFRNSFFLSNGRLLDKTQHIKWKILFYIYCICNKLFPSYLLYYGQSVSRYMIDQLASDLNWPPLCWDEETVSAASAVIHHVTKWTYVLVLHCDIREASLDLALSTSAGFRTDGQFWYRYTG